MSDPITNFKDSNGVDLGKKLVGKDYLISVYPEIGQQIGIPPELWTWGNATNGALGNGATTGSISTPITTFSGGSNWKQVSAGGNNFAAGIKTDGTLWVWGNQTFFRPLGTNDTTSKSTPVTTFSGGNDWKSIFCTSTQMAAIKTDGTLWTWGNNANGELGNGTLNTSSFPTNTFGSANNWKQVSGFSGNMAAIKTDGTLWTWGTQFAGQLGNGATSSASISVPITTFAGGNDWKQVACGSNSMQAIKTDGTLWTWGFAGSGALGNGVTTGDISTPVTTFAGGNDWKQVSIGAAIKTDGTLWAWGSGIANATITSASTPVTTFAGGNDWKQVTGSSAIKTDGTLWLWGLANSGRLGNGATTGTISTPVTTFAGGTNWKQVSGAIVRVAIQSVDFVPF